MNVLSPEIDHGKDRVWQKEKKYCVHPLYAQHLALRAAYSSIYKYFESTYTSFGKKNKY